MRNRTVIKTDEQLQNCINANLEVEVWYGGVLDCVSKIKKFDGEMVVIERVTFIREKCVLKIKGSHLKLVK
ncbi:hypothetical protein ABE504_32870 [Paenibacillus oryzisoli]|uniref:hypothetical protein n=1 Tax=Paenibacillus oryzisoli TaxID=1850517 RepID=UPI003D2E172B